MKLIINFETGKVKIKSKKKKTKGILDNEPIISMDADGNWLVKEGDKMVKI